jgi:hypothetical protein
MIGMQIREDLIGQDRRARIVQRFLNPLPQNGL